MKAEEVYNIAIHLSDNELERLFSLLKNKVKYIPNKVRRPFRKKLISDEAAREYLLKTLFKLKPKIIFS